MGDPTLRLLELDERHNELLDRLSELDQRVAGVLEEWTRTNECAENKKSNNDGNNLKTAASAA